MLKTMLTCTSDPGNFESFGCTGVQGREYSDAGHWRQAARWIGLAASQEYSPAYHYENGYGVLEDWEEAAFWYERSAVAGNPASQSNLGQMYED